MKKKTLTQINIYAVCQSLYLSKQYSINHMRLLYNLLTLLAISLTISSQATIHIINNSTAAPGQFASVQSAINIAVPGDTIYMAGTDVTYGAISINKQLTFIGPGFDLGSGSPSGVAQLGVVSLTSTTASNCKFMGLRIFQIISTDALVSLYTGISVLRCQIDDCLYLSNDDWSACTVEGCLFTSAGPNVTGNNSSANLIASNLRNNVFSGILYYVATNTIKNNLFLGNANGNLSIVFSGTNNTFHNNICIGRNCTSVDLVSNITANISFSCLNGNFNGTGNFTNTDPLFVSYPVGAYNWAYDFNLQVGSPAIGAGTDGVDIGVYGGDGIYRKDLEPNIPVVRSLSVESTNVFPVNSTITIQLNTVIHE